MQAFDIGRPHITAGLADLIGVFLGATSGDWWELARWILIGVFVGSTVGGGLAWSMDKDWKQIVIQVGSLVIGTMIGAWITGSLLDT